MSDDDPPDEEVPPPLALVAQLPLNRPKGTPDNLRSGKRRGQAEDRAVRAVRALELRMAGATYQQIADALSYRSKGEAFRSVERALAQEMGRAETLRNEYRALTLGRLERLIRSLWTKALGGDLQAVDRVLRLVERQSRILGLDAPVQIDVTETTRQEITVLLAELEEHLIIPGVVTDDDTG